MRALIHDDKLFESVALAGFEVVGIVSRGDLDGSGAEFGLCKLVENDGYLAAHEGKHHRPAVQMGVALIVRIDGDGSVAEHGLRARGGDDDGFARKADDGIADLPELALGILVHHFEVAQRGEAARTPVDDVGAAIDQSLFPEAHEGFAHGARELLVHGEELARPVDGVAKTLHLLEDVSAVLLLPLPDAFEEGLAADVLAFLALAGQLALHHHLGGNAGVIGSGEPHGILAQHALPAGEDVHFGVVEHVSHVQAASDVGRRQQEGIDVGAVGGGCGMEEVLADPVGSPASFNLGGIVNLWQFVRHKTENSSAWNLQVYQSESGAHSEAGELASQRWKRSSGRMGISKSPGILCGKADENSFLW